MVVGVDLVGDESCCFRSVDENQRKECSFNGCCYTLPRIITDDAVIMYDAGNQVSTFQSQMLLGFHRLSGTVWAVLAICPAIEAPSYV